MDLLITTLLTGDEVAAAVAGLAAAPFVDGRFSAGGAAAAVKRNTQLPPGSPQQGGIDALVADALRRSRPVQLFAVPRRVLPPTVARYEPGMEYGPHVDGAIMGGATPLRADLALTLFLSPPDSYDGGELVIESAGGPQEIKLPAGDAVVYPASTLHRVAAVTRGVRLVAVTWMQSAVRDERLRAILHDLAVAQDAGGPELLRLAKCYNNLMRYAADL